MKKGIHPENYRLVAFKDMSNDHVFLCRSAVSTKETIEVNGETYPVYKMEISNTSHPFYTGKMKLVDTAGRVDKFMSRIRKALRQEERCEVRGFRATRLNGLHRGCGPFAFCRVRGTGWGGAGKRHGAPRRCGTEGRDGRTRTGCGP